MGTEVYILGIRILKQPKKKYVWHSLTTYATIIIYLSFMQYYFFYDINSSFLFDINSSYTF